MQRSEMKNLEYYSNTKILRSTQNDIFESLLYYLTFLVISNIYPLVFIIICIGIKVVYNIVKNMNIKERIKIHGY